MSADLEPVYIELRSIVEEVWPDVTAGRTYETEHVGRLALEMVAADANGQAEPYAVLVIPEARPADLGMHNLQDFLDAEIWWIGRSQGPGVTARARVKAMRDYLWAHDDYASFQLWDDPPPQGGASRGLLPNQIFLARKLPLLAGRVTARLVVGEEAS